MMDRRRFLLRGLLATTGGALVPPSQLWPFRKIFLPLPASPLAEPIAYGFDMMLEWDSATGLFLIKGEKLEAMYKMLVGGRRHRGTECRI